MAIFNFTNPGQYGSAYFTLETVPNNQGFFDSSSFPNAQGYYSNFTNLNESYIVTSSYVFGVVVPPGSSSFEFNPSNSAMPTGSLYFRGTGGIGITVDTYSGSYVVSPSQGYNGRILNTFPLTPVPNFQARVAANSGSYEALSCQNAILADIGTEILSSASLLVTPNGYTEGVLFSTLPNSSSGDLTVTRATTATRTNADGLIELVPYNLVSYSEQFENGVWQKLNSNITSNAISSPNEFLTADLLLNSSSASPGVSGLNQSISVTANTYTISAYIKKRDFDWFRIQFLDYLAYQCYYNINDGTLGTIASGSIATITDVGNGWYRCTHTRTVSGATTLSTGLRLAQSDNDLSVIQDGIKGTYIWGAQLVEGTNALPYQRTTTRLNISRADYSLGGCPNILLEPQRTNLALRSEEFDNASWAKVASSITANSTTSPSGIANADTLTADGTFSLHQAAQAISVTSGVTYTFSVYAKKGTNNFIQLVPSSTIAGVNFWANFDLNNGVVGSTGSSTTASIQSVGNGWYRCIITGAAIATLSGTFSTIIVTSATALRAEANTLSTSVFLWGAQLEAGAYATSYIPTTSASVTRNQDVISKTGISSLLNPSEGTLFVDAAELKDNASKMFQITNGTDLNTVSVEFNNNTLRVGIVGGGGGYRKSDIPTNLYGFNKIAIGWISGNISCFVNGVQYTMTLYTGSGDGIPTQLDRITFSYWWTGIPFYANTKTIAIWKTRLTNDQLATLTTI
jgi:hypothetical protein